MKQKYNVYWERGRESDSTIVEAEDPDDAEYVLKEQMGYDLDHVQSNRTPIKEKTKEDN